MAYYFTRSPTVHLLMRDPPVEAYTGVSHIWVNFSTIQIHQVRSAGGDSWITLNSSSQVTVDLVAAITTAKDLGSFAIPTGNYTQMRLTVTSAFIVISGVRYPLMVSSSLTGLKIDFPGQLVLSASQSATITVDIAANDSLLHAPTYTLSATMTASFTTP